MEERKHTEVITRNNSKSLPKGNPDSNSSGHLISGAETARDGMEPSETMDEAESGKSIERNGTK